MAKKTKGKATRPEPDVLIVPAMLGRIAVGFLRILMDAYDKGFSDGWEAQKRGTTTGGSPAVSPVSKHRKRGAAHRTAGKK